MSTGVSSPGEIQIGYWATYCCHLDLYEIETDHGLEDARLAMQEWIDDEEPPRIYVWKTRRDALLEICKWQRKRVSPSTELAEIDAMLRECC